MSSQNGLKRDSAGLDTPPSGSKPTKIRRALAACKNCRKQKTRCDHTGGAPCHRCKVLGLECEFDNENVTPGSGPTSNSNTFSGLVTSPGSVAGDVPTTQRMDRFELRMERMENSIHELIAALQPSNSRQSQNQPSSSPLPMQNVPAAGGNPEEAETDEDDDNSRPTAGGTDVSEERKSRNWASVLTIESPAPVEIIRGLASEFLDHQSPKERNKYNVVSGTRDDIVSKGIVTESQTQELLDIFIKEYGKWIGFPHLPTLLSHLRIHSPLLLTAACLIASRHLKPSNTLDPLVSALFAESRRLLSLALLNVPRNVETLQAILILSVWSPLQKRENPKEKPLSGGRTLDSWLVSGYGLMLAMTVIRFNDLTRGVDFKGPRTPVGGQTKENAEGIAQRLRVWNHLCLIHLHYSVGTRRPCLLEEELIERCRAILYIDGIQSNHDQRMVAEIFLYLKLYRLLQRVSTDRRAIGTEEGGELQLWRDEWDYLFHEDGHQYIEIGYYFAHLMLRAQALKLLEEGGSVGRQTPVDGSPAARTPTDFSSHELKKSHMSAISQLSTQILNRARRVEVAEMRHVTDIIYFIIAFAGVSLCRLLPIIPIFGAVKAEEYRTTLNTTITESVEWLRSVAISEEHIAFRFAEIIHGLHAQTLRRERRRETATPHSVVTTPTDPIPAWPYQQPQQQTMGFVQPFPPTPTFLQSPTGNPTYSPFSGPGSYSQQGFGQQTGYDESYFVGLFPELMGPGFVDGGFAGGLGQGAAGGGGFDDALGFWGFRTS